MKREITLFLSAILISGCATTIPIPNKGIALRGKSVTFIKKERPRHPYIETDADIVGQTIGGLIGGAIIAGSASKKYSVAYQNPSNQIANAVVNDMVSKYSMNYIPTLNNTQNNALKVLDTIPKKNENPYKNYKADYIVDVETPAWGVYHLTMFKDRAGFYMKNSIKVIDRKKGNAIAQTQCKYKKEWEDNIPKYETILANNQQFIKDYTQKAISACINKINKDLLK